MKPLVIYHADCTDGYGAAFAAWLKLGDEAEYLPMQYGQVKTVAEMNSVLSTAGIPFGEGEVYILDFSLPKDVMAWLFSDVKRVVWLDHHKTAFEMWCGKAPNDEFQSFFDPHDDAPVDHYILLDNNKSGALLAWEYFHPGSEVPLLIQHIDDRDRWQFKLEGSKELHAALSSYKPWNFQGWRVMVNDWHIHGPDLLQEGAAILRAQNAHVQSMAKQARKCSIPAQREVPPNPNAGSGRVYGDYKFVNDDAGHWWFATGLAVNATLHQSEVGHELANQSGTYGLIWYVDSRTRVRCSLRSNGDYDVSAIARAFGGGGHRNAAGFETDITTLKRWLK